MSSDFLGLFDHQFAENLSACVRNAARGERFEVSVALARNGSQEVYKFSGEYCQDGIIIGSIARAGKVELFGAALEAIHDGVVIFGQEGVVLHVNRRARQILDQELNAEADASDLEPSLSAALSNALASGVDSSGNLRINTKDGARCIACSIDSAFGANGVRIGSFAILRDVTEARCVASSLCQACKEMQIILQQTPVALWGRDSAGHINCLNEAAARLFDADSTAAIGRSFVALSETAPQLLRDLNADAELFKSGDMAVSKTETYIDKAGACRWLKVDRAPFVDEETGEMLVLFAATDISDMMRSKEELRRSNSELEQFAKIASHDLKEPLRKIIFYSEFLRSDLGDDLPEAAEADLKIILHAAHRMRSLITSLLEYARFGGAAENISRVSPRDAIESALERIVISTSVTPKFDYEDLPDVYAFPEPLSQIYQNLISNSLKFAEPTRPLSIHFTAVRCGSRVILGVKDNGVGVEKELLSRIFEPLYRTPSAAGIEGTGFGLALCAKQVLAMRGRIWAESDSGEGLHIRIELDAPAEETHDI